MVAMMILAMSMDACRSMQIRLAYCRERADDYDCWAASLEQKAFWDGHAFGSVGLGPVWDVITATKVTAAGYRERAAIFRAVAWRVWLRPPLSLPSESAQPCPCWYAQMTCMLLNLARLN
jgi:hypothetical protein